MEFKVGDFISFDEHRLFDHSIRKRGVVRHIDKGYTNITDYVYSVIDLDGGKNYTVKLEGQDAKLIERPNSAISLDKINFTLYKGDSIIGIHFHGIPADMRGKGVLFTSSNGVVISSKRSPEIYDGHLDLCGINTDRDDVFLYNYYTDINDLEYRVMNKSFEALIEFNKFLLDKAA